MDGFPGFVKALPEIDLPLEGVKGWLLQGDGQQVAFFEFEDDVEVPDHSHGEQWELVVSGEVALRVEGKETVYRKGDSFHIPTGVVHGAKVKAGYRAVAVFDQADRYKAKE